MPHDIASTGEVYYSGGWEDIKLIVKVLKISNDRISQINQEMVNRFQEMVDREIDGMLSDLYWTPLRHFNQYQPDGTTKSVFPGNVQRLARYWTAGLLMSSQFQGLDANTNESANAYIEDSRKELFDIIKFQRRLVGQQIKHPLHSSPAGLMPPYVAEQNW